jgi:hypothetical protein
MESLPHIPIALVVFIGVMMAAWGWRTQIVRRDYDLGAAAASLGVAAGSERLKVRSVTGSLEGAAAGFASGRQPGQRDDARQNRRSAYAGD